jgi:hypothetical protein
MITKARGVLQLNFIEMAPSSGHLGKHKRPAKRCAKADLPKLLAGTHKFGRQREKDLRDARPGNLLELITKIFCERRDGG